MDMLTKATILLIDDVPANITSLAGNLRDQYRVIFATNGPDALDLANQQPVDLILLDVMMPDMDGYEVCRRLKANKLTREIPVIFVTALSEASNEVLGFEVGAVDYLHKPCSRELVRLRVQIHLERHQQEITLERRVQERTCELQQSENQLRASEARFRSLSAMSSDFYWETDAEHRFTMRTASTQEAMDPTFNQASFIGLLSWEVPYFAPDDAGWKAHQAILNEHLPFRNFEISRYGANHTVFHVAVSGDPVFDASGTFTGYRGVGANITERKKTEIELRVAATAFESQVGMLITNSEMVIQRVNTAFTVSTGYSANDIVGCTLRILQSDQYDKAFCDAIWEHVNQKGAWEGELWGKRKNGEVYPRWVSISIVRDGNGILTHYVASYLDLSERMLAEEKIRNLAFFDQLTGLPNRTLLMDRLQQAITANARIGKYGAVIFLDLDNLKSLNDTQGHTAGDQLLQQTAQRLVESVQQNDTVTRFEGDQFVILLSDLEVETPDEATLFVGQVCKKLLAALAQPYRLSDMIFNCNASIGITFFKGAETSIDDLLRQADMAMHQSKAVGESWFTFFDPAMELAVIQRAQIEADLREAIQSNQFELYYQPQVDGNSGQIVGAEALIRWIHPQRGIVSPAQFIPHIESTGLILPIGQWVLETACQHLAHWASRPEIAHLTVAVNVSAQQFQSPDFTEQVISALKRSGANPQRLKLELTESAFVQNAENIVVVMDRIKALGVSFSLDDFGTGYSSLSYLSRLPLDQLKIDRSFVSQIESGDNNVVICAATISLAHSLKLKVVAEGVETDAQQYFLSSVHRCDLLQGYLYSKPVPVYEFEELFSEKKSFIRGRRAGFLRPLLDK